MATYCYSMVRGRRMRVTVLDECGAPPAEGTPNSMAVTKGFVSVAVEVDVEDGDEFIVKNADGDLCINSRSRDQIKRLNLTMEFCQVDPGLFSAITGVELELDAAPGADVAGFRLKEGALETNFALEVWSGIPNTECVPGQALPSVYNLFPYVTNGILQGYTIENDAATFEITAWTQGGSGWGVGPYNVIRDGMGNPSPLLVPIDATTHLVQRRTTVAPPAAVCGLQPLGDSESS